MSQFVEFGLDTFGDITDGCDGRPLHDAKVIRNVIEEAVLADSLGVDFFGIGELHRSDYAISAPEVVLAAIASRTKHIRLGSAVTVLSSDDPIRVFQRFATLDAITSGRAEVILGRGWFTEAFSLFGLEVSQYNELFNEKISLFSSLIRHDTVTWRGQQRPSLIKQRVFPRIEEGKLKTWLAVGATSQSVLCAAQYDLPIMLAIIGGQPHRFTPFVELYRKAFEKLDRPVQPIGVHSTGYLANTDGEARDELWGHYKPMRDRLGAERGWPPIDRARFDAEADHGSLYVGSPETVARKIVQTIKTIGASRFDMKYSVGSMPHQNLLDSITLYGSKVVPLVRDMI